MHTSRTIVIPAKAEMTALIWMLLRIPLNVHGNVTCVHTVALWEMVGVRGN